jgi:DNA mismatch endonuclease (patch repair protein)
MDSAVLWIPARHCFYVPIATPDFVFQRLRTAVFVDGCFWHGCRAHCKQPAGNRSFWRRKLAGNKARDRRVNRTLRAAGWRVLRVWEHALTRHGEKRLLARLEFLFLA